MSKEADQNLQQVLLQVFGPTDDEPMGIGIFPDWFTKYIKQQFLVVLAGRHSRIQKNLLLLVPGLACFGTFVWLIWPLYRGPFTPSNVFTSSVLDGTALGYLWLVLLTITLNPADDEYAFHARFWRLRNHHRRSFLDEGPREDNQWWLWIVIIFSPLIFMASICRDMAPLMPRTMSGRHQVVDDRVYELVHQVRRRLAAAGVAATVKQWDVGGGRYLVVTRNDEICILACWHADDPAESLQIAPSAQLLRAHILPEWIVRFDFLSWMAEWHQMVIMAPLKRPADD